MKAVIADAELLRQIEEIYEEAFPPVERLPFSVLKTASDEGKMHIIAFTDGDDLLAFGAVGYNETLACLEYFAVNGKRRGQGIGSEVLQILHRRYGDRRLILFAETPDENADNNAQRLSRKAFYHRNGLNETGLKADLYGTRMDLLVFDKPALIEEYIALYKHFVGEEISAKYPVVPCD